MGEEEGERESPLTDRQLEEAFADLADRCKAQKFTEILPLKPKITPKLNRNDTFNKHQRTFKGAKFEKKILPPVQK